MKFLSEPREIIVSMDEMELYKIKRMCLNIEGEKAQSFTAMWQIIEAFSRMSPDMAYEKYMDIVSSVEYPIGRLIGEAAKEHNVSFWAADRLLTTGELPPENVVPEDF